MKPPLSRRRFLKQGSLALASAGPCRKTSAAFLSFGNAPFPPGGDLMSGPVEVPSDFVGIHAHRWPVGLPQSPPPAYPFGAVRSHDYDGASWNRIHVAPGKFDWSAMDPWVQAHKAEGRTLIYTVYGTPAWATSVPQVRDPYGHPGGSAPPKDLGPLGEFIQALVTRYNGDGVRQIDFIEPWNEPNFDTPNPGSFWIGTPAQLASMGRQIWRTAKAIDPQLRVLSPGFSGNLAGHLDFGAPRLRDTVSSPIYQYLSAADGVGGKGRQWCDGVAFHCYNAPLSGSNWAFLLEIRRMNLMLGLMGVNLPVFNTEIGFLPGDPFEAQSVQAKADTLRRFAAVHASQGVRGMYFYSHDDDYVGNPSAHPAIAKAIEDVHLSLAGRTLKQVTALPDGGVRVATTRGTFIW